MVPCKCCDFVVFVGKKITIFFILRLSFLSVPYTGCPYTGHQSESQRVNIMLNVLSPAHTRVLFFSCFLCFGCVCARV